MPYVHVDNSASSPGQVTLATRLDSTNDSVATDGPGTAFIDLSGTSPSAPGTTASTTVTGIGRYTHLTLYSATRGATGGTLDIYLQISPDGSNWIDWGHYTQIAAASAVTNGVQVFSKHYPIGQTGGAALVPGVRTAIGVNTSVALAANTFIGGNWGDRIRVVYVAGAGTSAGAAQVFLGVLT